MNAISAERSTSSSGERTRARRLALQALYQWQLTAMKCNHIAAQFETSDEFRALDREYFRELLSGIPSKLATLDNILEPALSWPIEEVDPIERAVLRIAAYELMFRPDLPYRVVINEAVALDKKFGAEQGHTFVNGVLDAVARQVRSAEYGNTKLNTGRS